RATSRRFRMASSSRRARPRDVAPQPASASPRAATSATTGPLASSRPPTSSRDSTSPQSVTGGGQGPVIPPGRDQDERDHGPPRAGPASVVEHQIEEESARDYKNRYPNGLPASESD